MVYFHSRASGTIYLLYVYAKNDAGDLTVAERKALKQVIIQLSREG